MPVKRSEINAAIREASAVFQRHGWTLPPKPKWDVTDFGLGNFMRCGLVLVNLTEQREYCEKLMYVKHRQVTPGHHHGVKKEDIICRWGQLAVELTPVTPFVRLQVNGEDRDIPTGTPLILVSGERITLVQGVSHAFWAESEYAIVGEVSTGNDDAHDNFFEDKRVGRFSRIEEDEPAQVRIVGD